MSTYSIGTLKLALQIVATELGACDTAKKAISKAKDMRTLKWVLKEYRDWIAGTIGLEDRSGEVWELEEELAGVRSEKEELEDEVYITRDLLPKQAKDLTLEDELKLKLINDRFGDLSLLELEQVLVEK